MKLGIFAKTFPGRDPATVLNASAKAGFDGVAYNMACSGLDAMPDSITGDQVTAITNAARDVGQSIFSLSGTYNMIHPDPAVRQQGHARLDTLATHARAIGTNLITLCTGTRDLADQWNHHPDNQTSEAWDDLLRSFEFAIQIAETHDILLGVEPELANVVNSAQAARRLIDQMQTTRIRIVLDPANLFETGDPAPLIEQAIDLLSPELIMAHAKDRDSGGQYITVGRGIVDFDHFIKRLTQAGFQGPIVTHGLSAEEAPTVAQYLRRCLP